MMYNFECGFLNVYGLATKTIRGSFMKRTVTIKNGSGFSVFRFIQIVLLLLLSLTILCACNKGGNTVIEQESTFRLIVPQSWELEVGDSRSVDYAFTEAVTDRKMTWSVAPADIASVDVWGRVTAQKAGIAVVSASTSDGSKDSVILKVTEQSKALDFSPKIVDFNGNAISLGDNLQKIITRYPASSVATSAEIPETVKLLAASGDGNAFQSASTNGGVIWSITDYGVLRTDNSATLNRDKEQRFMGDRYFYSADTTTGKIIGIIPDSTDGIWTVMTEGVTHIEMRAMTGVEKARIMSATTAEYVSRRGMVSEVYDSNHDGVWEHSESDNDGLWTAMYAAGELMRYASLVKAGASAEAIAEAKESATISTEAVLLLSNISMREGTVQAYVRYQPNGNSDGSVNGRFLSDEALVEGGDYSINLPYMSPADVYNYVYNSFKESGAITSYVFDNTGEYLYPYVDEDWTDPRTSDDEYAYRTRNLKGYVARTYSFTDEGTSDFRGYVHWQHNGDGTSIGCSERPESESYYYINGENLRGVIVDASGEIPARLWNDLIKDENYDLEDIIYKGDTSSDEIIGHLFLYKLAYDILGPVDSELKQIISTTMDNLAQHVSDNSYMMVDGSGQPGTWSKYNRAFFYNSSQMGGAPLTASVVLCLFKVAAYVTGYEKWENEYRMAALDPSYEYAELVSQYNMQCDLMMANLLAQYLSPAFAKTVLKGLDETEKELLLRFFLNYSDEEMAMLAFYLLFQLEDDEELLSYYRKGIDDWWISMRYSENPLWYYIYQLAYPDKTITDAYGNNILETAAWSLSRHSIDTRKYSASNTARDDYAELSLRGFGIDEGATLCYDIEMTGEVLASSDATGFEAYLDALNLLNESDKFVWAVAAPDERSFHKYNGESFDLNGHYNPYEMEGSTTYTLPFWMGIYHNMLTDVVLA